MELLSEYDGAPPKAIKKSATTYLNENNEWAVDYYVAGTIVKTKTFASASDAETQAALYKEGVKTL